MSEATITEKRDGKSAKDKGYSLRDFGSKVEDGSKPVVNMMENHVLDNQVKKLNHSVEMLTIVRQ